MEQERTETLKRQVLILANYDIHAPDFVYWSVSPRDAPDEKRLCEGLRRATCDGAEDDGREREFGLDGATCDRTTRGEDMSLVELFRRTRDGACDAEFYYATRDQSDHTRSWEAGRLEDESELAQRPFERACEAPRVREKDQEPFDFTNRPDNRDSIRRVSCLCEAAGYFETERDDLMWNSTRPREASVAPRESDFKRACAVLGVIAHPEE